MVLENYITNPYVRSIVLALGIIIAALIVSSALIMQTVKAYTFSLFGFILAGLLSMWLIHRTIFLKIRQLKEE